MKYWEEGVYFIWVLQLTALFYKAIWLCGYKEEVRVGQKVCGIRGIQGASHAAKGGNMCISLYVIYNHERQSEEEV